MQKGEGCYLIDVDGNRYLDFCCSWGPLITGHRPAPVVRALQEQIEECLTLGTPNPKEVELARFLVDGVAKDVKSVQRVRFVSSGTEAVMSALRLARGYTGRRRIVKFEGCYHGHSDALLVKAGSGLVTSGQPDSAGVPEGFVRDTIVLPLADEEAVRQLFEREGEQIAAVIIEPVPANNGLLIQSPEYLNFLREITARYGSLLIFDEVINGFRLQFSGAAGYYGIEPDLITYGKIIGGGLPVGAFAGRASILEKIAPLGPVYQAGTLSGNPMAMAAGLAQLKMLTPDVYEGLEEKGRYLEEQFNRIDHLPFRMCRLGSIFWLYDAQKERPIRADQIDRESMKTYAAFFHHCLDRGVYLAPSGYEVGFLSTPVERSDLDFFLSIASEFRR
jgi:glutamate-1-semialdehyde 2,1-aminomutase